MTRFVFEMDLSDLRAFTRRLAGAGHEIAEDVFTSLLVAWAVVPGVAAAIAEALELPRSDVEFVFLGGPSRPDIAAIRNGFLLRLIELKLSAAANWRRYWDARPCSACGFPETVGRWCFACGRMWQIDSYRDVLVNHPGLLHRWVGRHVDVDASARVTLLDGAGRDVFAVFPDAYGAEPRETDRAPDNCALAAVSEAIRRTGLADDFADLIDLQIAAVVTGIKDQSHNLPIPVDYAVALASAVGPGRRKSWLADFGDIAMSAGGTGRIQIETPGADVFLNPITTRLTVATYGDGRAARVADALTDVGIAGIDRVDEAAYTWENRHYRYVVRADLPRPPADTPAAVLQSSLVPIFDVLTTALAA